MNKLYHNFIIVSIPNIVQFKNCAERIGPQMAFGDKLKEIREQQNLSQLEVANALGVSDRTVSVWERNLKMPNLESAIRLSRFLNVSLDLLIDEQDEFIMKSEAAYGLHGKKQAEQILKQAQGLFAGGELDEEDRDAFFRAMTDIYFDAKERAKKYTPKKYREK